MKKIKLFAILCGLLMLGQHVSAQKIAIIKGYNGEMSAAIVSRVKYATFFADSNWFDISNGSVEKIEEYRLTASVTVGFAANSGLNKMATTPKVGICYQRGNLEPKIEVDECYPLGCELKDYEFTLKFLAPGTTYSFRAYIKLDNDVFYGPVNTATTLGDKPASNGRYRIVNGHKFIDLGLPSGRLWATCNIGAEMPTDRGDSFAWGETEPKLHYDCSNYKYGNSEQGDVYEYNLNDKKKILETEDDAAYVNWGSKCHVPKYEDFEELLNSDNCTWYSTYMPTYTGENVEGYMIVSNKNHNSIFLPTSYTKEGYWSSCSMNNRFAYALKQYDDRRSCHTKGTEKYLGLFIRPVVY